MANILVKEKEIVAPGDALAEGMEYVPGAFTYRQDDKLYSTRLGVANIAGRVVKVIPLSGKYVPRRGDVVIGEVVDILMSGWRMEINCAYSAILNMKDTSAYINKGEDLSKHIAIGDYVSAKITMVSSQKLVDVSLKGPGLQKLEGGRIISVNPFKVPRIIGKQGSMVGLLKQKTGCKIVVGQNGFVWVSGAPKSEIEAIETLKFIEENSHISGLTEKVEKLLSGGSK